MFGNNSDGWLFDEKKETTSYFLINGIQVNKNNEFTDFIIYSIKRYELIELPNRKVITKDKAYDYAESIYNGDGKSKKLFIDELDYDVEGYFTHGIHKKESPINLVLQLKFFLNNKVARQIYP